MKKEKPVFRRILAPLVLVLGFSLSFVGGVNFLKVEKERWQAVLTANSEAELGKVALSWKGLEAGIGGVEQLFTASEEVTQREFTYTARQLMERFPSVTGLIYLPPLQAGSASPYHMPYLYPNRAEVERLQIKFMDKQQIATSARLFMPPRDAGLHESSLVHVQRLGMSGELGTLFTVFNLEKMIQEALGQAPAGLFVQVMQGATPILARRLGQARAGGETAHAIRKETSWAGATWQFTWAYTLNNAGGADYIPAALVFIIGGLFTLLLAWSIWFHQGVGKSIHQQVVERTNQLEQASRRFRLITDNAYDLIAICNFEAVLEYVNSAYHRVLGYGREELRGQNLLDFIHKQDRKNITQALLEVGKGNSSVELHFRMQHKSGEWLYMEAVAKGLHDDNWTMKNVVIHCRDVTSRKQFAEDLARSEQRFRDFADASADWLWEVNDKLRFSYVSPGVSKVLGYEAEEIVGNMQLEMLFEKDGDATTRELIETRIQRRQPYRDIEFWTRNREGERLCLRVSGVPVLDENKHFVGYRGVASNITASKIDRENTYRLATTDHLTGLLNRRRFMEELERSVNLARRHKTQGVLIWIDLDRFKEINDTHGHEAGDKILQQMTEMLKHSFRSTDIIARLGGDEFTIIMHNIDVAEAQAKAQELIDQMNTFEVEYKGARLSVTMSIGMVTYPQEDKDSEGLMMAADLAMYRAKDMGRNRMYVETEDSTGGERQDSVRAQLKWVNRLRTCLETGDFEMHFQPIVPGYKKQRPLFEALLRIYDEDGNVGSPAIYIDAAEHFGLIQQLDLSVVERCFQTQRTLREKGVDADFSINLSSRSLGDPEVINVLKEMLRKTDVDPNRIMFEVTETMALHDPSSLRDIGEIHAFISEIRSMGFRFAIDDFGTGFSSFNYLRLLPVDVVKIDGSFIKDLETSKQDRLFLESIVMLCKGLGIRTIAEFVENEKIVKILTDLGVDYAQGWHLGRPAPDIEAQSELFKGKRMEHFLEPAGPVAAEKKKKPATPGKKAKTSSAKPRVAGKTKKAAAGSHRARAKSRTVRSKSQQKTA
jgi:diguanylate cyclase (GGDEF)-like protein/PAS domain S-box-containing protein